MSEGLKWASLHCHDYLSLLDGLSSPLDNFSRAIEGNLSAIAVTNHGNMSSVVKLQKSRKQYIDKVKVQIEKSNSVEDKEILAKQIESAKALKLIFGNEMYLAVGPKENAHLVVLAKNLQGYKKLIKATSESTRRENFYRRPRLTVDQLSTYAGDLVVIDGHPGSVLYRQVWIDEKASFGAKTYEEARSLVHPDWKKRVLAHIGMFKDAFSDNYFLESQLIDAERIPAARVAVNIYRWAGKQTATRVVSTADSHYPTKDRAEDQRILLCSQLKTTLPKINRQIANDEDDIAMGGFFLSDKYYLPTAREMCNIHLEEEIRTSLEIAESCEEYELSNKPVIPKFNCPEGMNSDEYMTFLCREGYKEKLSHLKGNDKQLYGDRVREELNVFLPAGLADYFLLVRDIVDWVKNNGGMIGEGRGSVGGCLIAYLMGITAIDSIEHILTFSRFYNSGRNSPGNVSLPDIDIDIEPNFKEKVMNYLKNKYGKNKVAKISTYTRLMGRACLSEVLRVKESIPFDEVKRCTQFIPDENAITDDLNEMKEETGESSILMWALENNAKELKEWVWLSPKGEIEGPLADEFRQGIRLEGIYKNKSQHPGGIVIYPDNIENHMPVIYDKDGETTIAFDLKDCELSGGTKIDVLSSDILTKIKNCAFAIENEFLLEQ